MSEFSVNQDSAFENLSFTQVSALITVLLDRPSMHIEQIKRKFLETSSNFSSTLKFIKALNLVEQTKNHEYSLSEHIVNGELPSKREIINRLFSSKNEYNKEIYLFLHRFSVFKDEISYSPNPQTVSSESYVRNFLMEIGIVLYKNNRNKYFIPPEFFDLYATAQDNKHFISPKKLNSLNEKKAEIGLSVELEAVDYEKRRVGRKFESMVHHVSLFNSGAGYDIRSVTISANEALSNRFIEVKAVPISSYEFYLSIGEIEAAKKLRSLYYLYLIPFEKAVTSLEENIVIIRDPLSQCSNEGNNLVLYPTEYKCAYYLGEL